MLKKLISISWLFLSSAHGAHVSATADSTANYAVKTYQHQMVDTLRRLVKHDTVAVEGLSSVDNPKHQAFKRELAAQAETLGFDFKDKGYVIIIGLGDNKDRLGIITHGDIQPSNAKKWHQSPFDLDLTSQPGKLIGRGSEDDKGPISSALYAMKAIKDQGIKLNKRIELYIYMAEESDWQPLQAFIKHNSLPQLNITLDSEYPVVTAEKAYGTISMTFPEQAIDKSKTYLKHYSGGFFGSQIPEDAKVVIANASKALAKKIKAKAQTHNGISYDFQWQADQLTITALGKSAHSSTPEHGVNAITHLADLLSEQTWPNNASGALVNFINDLLGTGLYGKKFGDIAYRDVFMGDLTVAPTVLKQLDDAIVLNINTRRPRGKTNQQLTKEIQDALAHWQQKSGVNLQGISSKLGQPFVQTGAPHIETLLSVFSHYTGIKDAKPISIGGGTNSRLFPNAVSFGPSMPNVAYTGHTEGEFITMKQFVLNLKMYTAALVELTK